jgi:hypothetical protein
MRTAERAGLVLCLLFLACEEDVITQAEWDRLAYPTLAPFDSPEAWDEHAQRLDDAGQTVTAGCEPIHHTVPMSGDSCYVEQPGPDTGDQVLPHGDHFAVLRDGLVFTCADAAGAGAHLSELDPIPDELTTEATTYRMFLRGDRLVVTATVIDYAELDGDTLVSLIDVDAGGGLGLVGLHVLQWSESWAPGPGAALSADGTLALVDVVSVPARAGALLDYPRLRRWLTGTSLTAGSPFVSVTQVGRPIQATTYHSLVLAVRCEVLAEPFACAGQGVIAPQPWGRLDAADAFYFWGLPEILTDGDAPFATDDTTTHSVIYRVPLDDGPVTGVRLRGSMLWWGAMRVQGSELEAVAVNNGYGDPGATALFGEGGATFVRIPLATFTLEAAEIPAAQYQPLAGEKCDHATWEAVP